MYSPPHNRKQFEERRERFEAWITARGAEILTPTNEWELCRFRTEQATVIAYTNKHGKLSWHPTNEAYIAFLRNASWRAGDATKRRSKSSPTCQALRQRDGDACFFCHLPVAIEDESPEHLVALTHGGPDHIANMALAHRDCNREAGHLPLMEKIHLRESKAVQLAVSTFYRHHLGEPYQAPQFPEEHFEVRYTDPETGEPVRMAKAFRATAGTSAREWAEDWAYGAADKGRYEVIPLQQNRIPQTFNDPPWET
jgi:5-methylcytosine-specific restriction endonuclease McrA